MTVYHCKVLQFARARFYKCQEINMETGNPSRIQQYFKHLKTVSKLDYQMFPVATEQLSLFQAMGDRSDIRALKTNQTCYFYFSVYLVTPTVIVESVQKYPSIDFFLQGSKAMPSFLNTLAYSSFPFPDKSHHWHQCQAFVNNHACRYPMYKFILLLFINSASATPSEHNK